MRLPLPAALFVALAGCAAPVAVPDPIDADAVLLGEQHDAERQPPLQEQWVRELAQRGRLAALALEMAERGASTAGLSRDASEAQVQQALHWNAPGWPWQRYRPAILAAVRAGVPVLGANLPRADQASAMRDATLDRLLPGPALKAQQQAIRLGHCELLPENQITPMTRIQIARDQAMARTIAQAAAPGKVVLLLAGAGHVKPDVGVPRHLPATVKVLEVELPPEPPADGVDHCAALRREMEKKG